MYSHIKLLLSTGFLLVALICFPTFSDASVTSEINANNLIRSRYLRNAASATQTRNVQTYGYYDSNGNYQDYPIDAYDETTTVTYNGQTTTFTDNGDGTVIVETTYSTGTVILSWLIPLIIIIVIVIASCSCCKCCVWYPYMCCASPEEKEEILRQHGRPYAKPATTPAYPTATTTKPCPHTTPSHTAPVIVQDPERAPISSTEVDTPAIAVAVPVPAEQEISVMPTGTFGGTNHAQAEC